MHLKFRVLLAIGCVSLLAMGIPALGKPAPRGLAHHQRTINPQRNIHKKKIVRRAPVRLAKPHAAPAHQTAHLVSTPVALPPKRPMFGWPALVREARRYIGTNPTARTRLWCATFMNLVLARLGYAGTNSDAARSFADYGHRISAPEIGAIAVLARGKSGGHVGVVSGIDSHGNPIIISGNHGHRVGEGVYPRSRVIAYVMPSMRRPDGVIHVAERTKPIAASQLRLSTAASLPSQPRFEPIIDSPITELLAAIEAEQTRPRASAHAARPPAPRHAAQRMPGRAQQFARQVMHRPGPHTVAPARRELQHRQPRNRFLAKIFGSKARASVAPPPRSAPRHQRPVHARDRYANSYVGPAVRQPAQR